jgi:hypothetical protein
MPGYRIQNINHNYELRCAGAYAPAHTIFALTFYEGLSRYSYAIEREMPKRREAFAYLPDQYLSSGRVIFLPMITK